MTKVFVLEQDKMGRSLDLHIQLDTSSIPRVNDALLIGKESYVVLSVQWQVRPDDNSSYFNRQIPAYSLEEVEILVQKE